MKKDLIVLNIWMERKYKGYRYLKKSVRRRMYRDSKMILQRLEYEISLRGLKNASSVLGKSDEKLDFLFSIMDFLKPGKYYKYIKTASFGKLLRNPLKQTLEGDCNQIVTLYIYLYSSRFPVSDLQIKLLPEHVCLHYKGVDIEATNGTFQNYKKFDYLLPVTEIISTNLLDLADFREETVEIKPRVFLKASELAYAVSSLKDIVAKNLKVAYKNLAISEMNRGAFNSALFYAEKLNDSEFLRSVKRNFAVSLYKKSDFEKSSKLFHELNDIDGEKACFSGMYNMLVKQVSGVSTQQEFKAKKHIYRKMLKLAKMLDDKQLIDSLEKILK
jgi:hypothetical protein